MSKLTTALRLCAQDKLHRPILLIDALNRNGINSLFLDSQYVKARWRLRMGSELDLKNPKTFNEKIQWLKLYNRRPEYTMMADKYKVREYVASKIGEEHLIPLLGVWEDPEQIDFDALPKQFVLKCNHDSGSVIICTDKASFDRQAAVKKLKANLSHNYFWHFREWAYKDIPPRVIAEEYIADGLDNGGGQETISFFALTGNAG